MPRVVMWLSRAQQGQLWAGVDTGSPSQFCPIPAAGWAGRLETPWHQSPSCTSQASGPLSGVGSELLWESHLSEHHDRSPLLRQAGYLRRCALLLRSLPSRMGFLSSTVALLSLTHAPPWPEVPPCRLGLPRSFSLGLLSSQLLCPATVTRADPGGLLGPPSPAMCWKNRGFQQASRKWGRECVSGRAPASHCRTGASKLGWVLALPDWPLPSAVLALAEDGPQHLQQVCDFMWPVLLCWLCIPTRMSVWGSTACVAGGTLSFNMDSKGGDCPLTAGEGAEEQGASWDAGQIKAQVP